MRYLFCTDGSDGSFSALEAALKIAFSGAVVDIFCVLKDKNDLKKLNKDDCEGDFECENLKKITQKSKEIIEEHAHFLGEVFIEHGDVQKIIEHVEKTFYNMLILGSRNYKGLKNRIWGFSRKLVEKSSSPVFIFHSGHIHHEEDKKKVLICVDDSYATFNAVISFMKNFNMENDVVLLTVESQFFSHQLENCLNDVQVQEFTKKEIALLDRNMDEIEKILCHNRINVKSKIHLRGNPSEEILNFVKQDFDLIVLGSHAKKGLIDFLFGSVSKNIVDYVNIPVLIIPTKAS